MESRFRLVLYALLLHAAAVSAATFQVNGTITSPSGPAAGVRVEFRTSHAPEPDAVATTDAAGAFSAAVPEGRATIHFVSAGNLFSDDLRIEIRENLTLRLEMAPPVTLEVRALVPEGIAGSDIQIEVYSLTADRRYGGRAAFDGRLTLGVYPDLYSVHARVAGRDFHFGRVNLDTRGSAQVAVTVPMTKNVPVITRMPPRASLIQVSAADADGVSTITGAAGCAEPLATIAAVNLDTRQVNFTVSRADGSFSLPLFAPPGSHLQIKHDPTGRYLPNMNLSGGNNDNFEVPPGTFLYIGSSENGTASWTGTGMVRQVMGNDLHLREVRASGIQDAGQWTLTTTGSPRSLTPGETVTLAGKLTIHGKEIDASTPLGSIQMHGYFGLEKTLDPAEGQREQDYQFVSSLMTPTGLPIERRGFGGGIGTFQFQPLRFVANGRLQCDWSVTITIPANLPHGYYQPRFFFSVQNLPPPARRFDTLPTPEAPRNGPSALPLVRVGAPPPARLSCVLALDDAVNGLRGSVAVEDRGRFQIASHVAINSDQIVLPPVDLRTGEAIRYRLEPFAPLVSSSNGRIPLPPQIPFRFPSGSLRVRVIRPDGMTDDLGSAPFQQAMSRTPVTRTGIPIAGASAHVSDYLQLTTLDPRFDYAFTQHGLHRVLMELSIEDVNGNVYLGGGTYEIWAARPLDLESAVLPGTPFEIGDRFTPALVMQPGVPAEVTVRLRVFPDSDPAQAVTYEVNGMANRFGFFSAGSFPPFERAGEYRVDVLARHTDAAGVVWAGTATWGNVVETPNSPLITHGRRGFDNVNAIQQQWFFVREARAGGDHVMFPFHRGDVMWMQHDDPAADIPKITVQDPTGAFAARVKSHQVGGNWEPPAFDERLAAGEIPLFSSTSRANDSPSYWPSRIDQWGYFYAYAERPGVRVREFISEDTSSNGYWRFADNYNFQLGNGINGDRPNDFKFQFGGAVWREAGFSYYGAYGSFFVLLPFNDALGGRVFPPFQGNGGGPDGGPLFTLKGKAIDLFFHPTAVRPGSILHRGSSASFTGYAAPTLPAKVEIVVTSPSGVARTIAGKASKIGYFHDPAQDFAVGEPGVWKANVKIVYDGLTSAGQVTAPFPTGDVLGSRSGEFYFYVVDAGSDALALGALPQIVRPADGPITFTILPPSGLSDRTLTYTITMPGFILEERTQTSMTCTYDAAKLAQDFPNLDLRDSDGFAGTDTITLSFLVSGTDSTGAKKHYARQIVIQGEELQQPDQGARPRRRAVR